MAKTLVEVRNPNDPGHIGDHELSARLLNELYGVAAYAPAAGGTVNPDIALGGVHEIALPAGAITVGPIVSSDSAAIQRYNPGQRLVLVLTQPAAGGATVTWDASWRRTTSGIDPRPNAVTTIEFVNDAAAGAAPQWRPSAIAPTALESVRVWHTDTANPAVVVRGAAAQAANLTEWQSSAGTVVAKVDQVGSLQARLGTFAAGAATEVPLTAQGAASQTADLQRWLSSAAAVLAKVDAAGILTAAGLITAGVLTVSGGGAHSIVGSLTETGQTLSKPSVASQVPQVMQGFASQTADLTQWQSSAGTVLAKVDASGNFATSGFLVDPAATGPMLGLQGTTAFVLARAAGNVPLTNQGAASQTADLQRWQNSAGAVLSAVAASGDNSTVGVIQAGQLMSAGWLGGVVSAKARSATDIAQVVRAFASQTADLTQWQNSAGTVLSKIDANGNAFINAVYVGSGGASVGGSQASVVSPAAGQIAFAVKAAAAQTADLTRWLDSAGTIKAFVRNDGQIQSNVGIVVGTQAATTGTGAGGAMTAQPPAANQAAMIAKAAVGQTADIWQVLNSSGTILAHVDSTGQLGIANSVSTGGMQMGPRGLPFIYMGVNQASDFDNGSIYQKNGALFYKGSNGTVTQVAAA